MSEDDTAKIEGVARVRTAAEGSISSPETPKFREPFDIMGNRLAMEDKIGHRHVLQPRDNPQE